VDDNMIWVYDCKAGEAREVTRAEAAADIMRFARELGPGTPACGEWEKYALRVLQGEAP
jgi:hypothetical protein